ncbi:glutathione S-transferase 1 [Galendromus occidentalis]|uniref:Glutathione S-transferase 1 n=1 Tax=Galendromus occidentalis TaxID=34638 RepID=A0AAJ6QTE1_9ACAR|nr:glutathione S-transferase 1 [Galendromus occidentalis]
MVIDFYQTQASPPVRAVALVAASLNVSLNPKPLDIMEKKEHLEDWYIKLNPQHTVPTIVDGDLALAESRAIMCYLANEYAPDSPLYPKCPRKRALVDRFLYFDIGTLFKSFADYFYPNLLYAQAYDPEKEPKVKESIGFLETFLGDNDYLVDNAVTIADLAIATSLTLPDSMDYSLSAFPKVEAYYKRLQGSPKWDEINGLGIEIIRGFRSMRAQ